MGILLMIFVVGLAIGDRVLGDAEENAVVLALSTTRTFSCSQHNAFTLVWSVNGERADFTDINGIVMGDEEHLGGSLLQRNLTVTAREEHDGLTLKCNVTVSRTIYEVYLVVQGLLPPPGSVTTVSYSSSIFLSWTAPSTLDITDVDPDISHYTVYTTNLNTSQNWSVNVTETEFNFTGLPGEGTPDPCHTYQFTVSAWNVVGEGNRSEPVYGYFIAAERHGGFASNPLNATVFFERDERITNVSCSFQVDCPGQMPDIYMGDITPTYNTMADPMMFMIDHSYILNTITWTWNVTFKVPNNVVNDLPLNDECHLKVFAAEDTRTALNTTFRTFGIQNATVEASDSENTVTVTCYFAEGSTAIGCHVKLVPDSGSCAGNQSINVTRMIGQNMGVATEPIPNGTYSAYVHDHESDGSISLNPALSFTELNVAGELSLECSRTPQPTGTGPTTPPSFSTPSDDKSQKKSFPFGAVIGVCIFITVITVIAIVIIVILIKIRQRHIKVDTADPNLYVESNPVKSTTHTDGAHRPPQGYASVPLRSDSSSSDSSSGSPPSPPSTESSDMGSPPLYNKLDHGNTAGGHAGGVQVTPPEDYERLNLQQSKPVTKFNPPQGTEGLTYAALAPARQPAPVHHDHGESTSYAQVDFRAMAAKALYQKNRPRLPVQPDSVQNRDSLTD